MKPGLPVILSLNAGYVDTAGFLALHGLFTAHVTGNFVMIGDALAHGSTGLLAKLLALPVFCITILAVQIVCLRLGTRPERALPAMLGLEIVLLAAGGIAAVGFHDFDVSDSAPMLITGMLLVAGMAVQNGAHRQYLASAPPTTLMTGTTTQVMLDLAALLAVPGAEAGVTLKPRLAHFLGALFAFASGCALAAAAVTLSGPLAFLLPPLVVATGLLVLTRRAPQA